MKVRMRPKRLTLSKELLPKKEAVTLPVMRSTYLKDEDISPKDKKLQDLFLKIAKR